MINIAKVMVFDFNIELNLSYIVALLSRGCDI
jgi:hypothetical protein